MFEDLCTVTPVLHVLVATLYSGPPHYVAKFFATTTTVNAFISPSCKMPFYMYMMYVMYITPLCNIDNPNPADRTPSIKHSGNTVALERHLSFSLHSSVNIPCVPQQYKYSCVSFPALQ